jgi:hypothetical protein
MDDADLMSQKNLSDKSLQLKQGSIAGHPSSSLMTEQAIPHNEEEVKGVSGDI